MNGKYKIRNTHKLRGDLDERITQAADILADDDNVFAVEIPDKAVRHSKSKVMLELIGMPYKVVKGGVESAAVRVGLYARDGYGKIVEVYSASLTGARNFVERFRTRIQPNPEPCFPPT